MAHKFYIAFIAVTVFCQTHKETAAQLLDEKKGMEMEEILKEADFFRLVNFGNNTNWENVEVNMNRIMEIIIELETFEGPSSYTNAETRKLMLTKGIKDMKRVVEQKELVKTNDDVQKLCKDLAELAHEYYTVYDGFYVVIATSFLDMFTHFTLDHKYFCSQKILSNFLLSK